MRITYLAILFCSSFAYTLYPLELLEAHLSALAQIPGAATKQSFIFHDNGDETATLTFDPTADKSITKLYTLLYKELYKRGHAIETLTHKEIETIVDAQKMEKYSTVLTSKKPTLALPLFSGPDSWEKIEKTGDVTSINKEINRAILSLTYTVIQDKQFWLELYESIPIILGGDKYKKAEARTRLQARATPYNRAGRAKLPVATILTWVDSIAESPLPQNLEGAHKYSNFKSIADQSYF